MKKRQDKRRWLLRCKLTLQRWLQPKVETLMSDQMGALERKIQVQINEVQNQIDLAPALPADWRQRIRPPATYLSFEDVFRDPAIIAERNERYIPLLAGHAPILDIGCGRGEFLKLLERHRIASFGIDNSPEMISRCRQQGLNNVAEASALDYLRSAADHSLGGIFSSHVIEHWPVAQLAEFFTLCRNKLKPGGIAIIETVNPHCLPAFKLFWLDPTHVRPLFPEFLEWHCLAAGFTNVSVRYLTETGFATTNPSHYGNYAIIAHASR